MQYKDTLPCVYTWQCVTNIYDDERIKFDSFNFNVSNALMHINTINATINGVMAPVLVLNASIAKIKIIPDICPASNNNPCELDSGAG